MDPERRSQRGVFPRFGIQEDVDREILAHLELRAEELVRAGWEPAAAYDEARRLFGDPEGVARKCRDISRSHHNAVRRMKMIEVLWQDVRYGVRTMWRNPAFAVVAAVTLALGIGANTAIFSVVNGVLIKPLPYDDPEELVWIREISVSGDPMSVAWANFVDWRRESRSFAGLTAYGTSTTTVLGGSQPVRARITAVSDDFWSVFALRPLHGRLIGEADYRDGAPSVAVATQSFWENELGGGPLDDRVLEVAGARVQIVGVVADDFDFPSGTDMWGVFGFLGQSDSRTAHNWSVVGRLATGVTVEQAREEIDALTKRLVTTEVDADPDYLATGVRVTSLHGQIVGNARTPLLLLLGAAGLVLLVACANLASTLLARGTTRLREMAVRSALGANRSRIVRQLLTESLVMAALGGAGGVGVAVLVLRGLQAMSPSSLPRLAEIQLDGWALSYTGAVALLTALVFGLLPASRLTRQVARLRDGHRGNAARGRGVWHLLVGAEVAMALVLLVGSGLLVRSFQTLLGVDAGFDASDVGALGVSLSTLKYETDDEHARWYSNLVTELEALPDVEAAGVLSTLPVQGFVPSGRLELDGDVNRQATGAYLVASTGAFRALDIPLLRGRLFEEGDGPDAVHVAVVSRLFAETHWPGEDPIGKSVSGGGMDNLYRERPFSRVVGVVGDVRFRHLADEALPAVYFPHTQRPFRIRFGTSVVVESTSGDAEGLTNAVRATLARMDPDVPLRFSTMNTLVGESVAERRFMMLVLGAFSLTAFLLAGVGIYGVVSYSVARRTREMGIRLALGADPTVVLRTVVLASMRVVATGLILGLLGSLVVSRLMSSLLYGVGPSDPVTLLLVVLMLGGFAGLASWLPARAGTRVDPMITMRVE